MSTEHDVLIIRLGPVTDIPGADAIGLTEVEGRPCIVRKADFREGDTAVYVPIDSIVDVQRPEFAFLAERAKSGKYRVKAMKLRGVYSMGLVIKVPESLSAALDQQVLAGLSAGASEGDTVGVMPGAGVALAWSIGTDVREALGITVYDPETAAISRPGASVISGQQGKAPPVPVPVYDVESARKWRGVLTEGEEVVLTEKVHGANARFLVHDGTLYVGSRTTWKKAPTEGASGGMWWDIAQRYDLANRLPERVILFGEVYGQVQDLRYGCTGTELVIFDALSLDVGWLPWCNVEHLATLMDLPTVPVIYQGPWNWETCKELAEGPSLVAATRGAQHVREGWVLRMPTQERTAPRLGRVIMKLVGEGYNLRKGG